MERRLSRPEPGIVRRLLRYLAGRSSWRSSGLSFLKEGVGRAERQKGIWSYIEAELAAPYAAADQGLQVKVSALIGLFKRAWERALGQASEGDVEGWFR